MTGDRDESHRRGTNRLAAATAVILPGLLLAATGVGAGDLATGALAGVQLGTAILWAIALGALIKFALNDGIARYQLATGQTILEGICLRLGPIVPIVFGVYLVLWSLVVGRALMAACGATAEAMVPLGITGTNPELPWLNDRNAWAMIHSMVGAALVFFGGFKLFAKVMAGAVAVMFICVIATAIALRPDPIAVLGGLIIPRIPDFTGEGLGWTIALMGGVGGTLTVICYSYWIREAGRRDLSAVRTCRIDLAAGYTATALFGIAMVTIAARLGTDLTGGGAGLIVAIAEVIGGALTPGFRWFFLIGAWAAMFSSLLGVWQSVPYVFADYCTTTRHGWGLGVPRDLAKATQPPRTSSRSYRVALLALAIVPAFGLAGSFAGIQKVYAVFGAAFIPFLAAALLVLNSRRHNPTEARNGRISAGILIGCLVLALTAAGFEFL